jgi:tRNA threonylcarbamoyladenosine biosynthesis protein TsaB
LRGELLLGIDTCGASGSIALGRVVEGQIDLRGERSITGGEYGASLLEGIADLLAGEGVRMSDLAGIVVAAGPGSFTGIRIGLATAKGLAEAAGLPVVTVSRLALLAEMGTAVGVQSVVLDAHRGQVFCGIYEVGDPGREMLLTAGEINAMGGLPLPVAVCDESVAQFLENTLELEPLRVAAPDAKAALSFGLLKWQAGEFADLATLDGYYLRGADAKIAGRA